MWRREEVKGKTEEVTGIAKEKAGKLTNDRDLEAEGIIDQATGRVRQATGAAKRHVDQTVRKMKKGVNR